MGNFKDKFANAAKPIVPRNEPRPAVAPKAAPTTMAKLIVDRDEALDRAEAAEAQLESVMTALRAPLDQLFEVPGRRRFLSPESYAELKSNIRQHGMVAPITVQRRAQGGYEIVSGHHRSDILRELHAEDPATWPSDAPIHLDESTDSQRAQEKAFYANLMQQPLPDFEKYLGLKGLIDGAVEDDVTHEKLAQRTGLSRTTVTYLLKFGSLPEAAQKLLEEKRDAFTAKMAAKFATLTKNGMGDKVTEAVRQIVRDNIEPDKALNNLVAPAQKAERAKPIAIRCGKSIYCTVTPVDKFLRLEFKSEGERLVAQQMIQEVLEKLAELDHPGKK